MSSSDSSSLEVCCLLHFFDFLLALCAFTVFGGRDFAIFFDHGLTTVAFSVGCLARVDFHRSLDMLDELREGCSSLPMSTSAKEAKPS